MLTLVASVEYRKYGWDAMSYVRRSRFPQAQNARQPMLRLDCGRLLGVPLRSLMPTQSRSAGVAVVSLT